MPAVMADAVMPGSPSCPVRTCPPFPGFGLLFAGSLLLSLRLPVVVSRVSRALRHNRRQAAAEAATSAAGKGELAAAEAEAA